MDAKRATHIVWLVDRIADFFAAVEQLVMLIADYFGGAPTWRTRVGGAVLGSAIGHLLTRVAVGSPTVDQWPQIAVMAVVVAMMVIMVSTGARIQTFRRWAMAGAFGGFLSTMMWSLATAVLLQVPIS